MTAIINEIMKTLAIIPRTIMFSLTVCALSFGLLHAPIMNIKNVMKQIMSKMIPIVLNLFDLLHVFRYFV